MSSMCAGTTDIGRGRLVVLRRQQADLHLTGTPVVRETDLGVPAVTDRFNDPGRLRRHACVGDNDRHSWADLRGSAGFVIGLQRCEQGGDCLPADLHVVVLRFQSNQRVVEGGGGPARKCDSVFRPGTAKQTVRSFRPVLLREPAIGGVHVAVLISGHVHRCVRHGPAHISGMPTSTSSRVRSGVPAGGQFAAQRKSEAEGGLLTGDPLDQVFSTPEAKLDAVAAAARRTMDEHGLTGWSFRFDGGTRRLGATSHREKLITLGREPAKVNTAAQIRDVILHEVAHALVGERHRHNNVWKAKAAEIGARPERIAEPTEYNRLVAGRNQVIRDKNRPDPNVTIGTLVTFTTRKGTTMTLAVEGIEEFSYRLRLGSVVTVSVPCSQATIAG